MVAEILPPDQRPRPNPGPGRRDRGQTGSESATPRFARFGARKATAIGAPARAGSGHSGQWVKFHAGGGRQSIIAALRMHTMVACAGFPLRLRIRWGISQRYRSVSPAVTFAEAPPTSTSSSPSSADRHSTEPRNGRSIRARRPDRPENHTIAASRQSSASRSPRAGKVRRRRRRSASCRAANVR